MVWAERFVYWLKDSVLIRFLLVIKGIKDIKAIKEIKGIKGTSESISRILQSYNICVAHKSTTTSRHLLTNIKDRKESKNRQGAVHKIKCSDCQASYIDETGRNLNTNLVPRVSLLCLPWKLEEII